MCNASRVYRTNCFANRIMLFDIRTQRKLACTHLAYVADRRAIDHVVMDVTKYVNVSTCVIDLIALGLNPSL